MGKVSLLLVPSVKSVADVLDPPSSARPSSSGRQCEEGKPTPRSVAVGCVF